MEPSNSADHQPDRERRALGFALAAVAGWSTVATAFKIGLAGLTPAQLLFAGTLVSTILFAVAASARRCWRIDPRSLAQAIALGLVNPVLYYLVLFEAYDRLPAQIAQPLNYTWTLVLGVLAVPVLRQPFTAHMAAGMLVSYAGVALLITRGRLDGWQTFDTTGLILIMATTVIWAGYWLANARSRVAPLTLMTWSFLFATPVLALVCWFGPGLPPLRWHTVGSGLWVGLLEMGLTFLLWQRALRLTRRAARMGQLVLLTPFLSLVLIATVLGEAIHPTAVAGLAVIVAGILIARR
jgi:drug/metabolite transporter (DMT)-like permease